MSEHKLHTESMPHAALCDVCEQRPGDRRVLAAGGIETWVCGPCVGDDEPVDAAGLIRELFDRWQLQLPDIPVHEKN